MASPLLFQECRSEPGADRGGGRLVLVLSRRQLAASGDVGRNSSPGSARFGAVRPPGPRTFHQAGLGVDLQAATFGRAPSEKHGRVPRSAYTR
jgi:hypothetical protein